MRYILLMLLFCSGLVCRGQAGSEKNEEAKDLTKLEEFSSKAGNLIEKEFFFLGEVKELEINLLTIRDLIKNTKIEGVKFEVEYSIGSYGSIKRSTNAFIDYDEIDGMVKSLTYLKNNVFATQRLNYTEVAYKSRSGVEVGAYFDENKKDWHPFLKVSKYISDSNIYPKIADLDMLITSLSLAKKMIEDPERK